MTNKKGENKGRVFSKSGPGSKSRKAFLTVLAAFLTFAGPTYVVYVFRNILEIDVFVSMFSGIVLFIAGLVFVWYLIRTEVIS